MRCLPNSHIVLTVYFTHLQLYMSNSEFEDILDEHLLYLPVKVGLERRTL
jgi:hypothetical protein